MEKVFVYGTLQDPNVQKKVLKRTCVLEEDLLTGYRKGQVQINGNTYPIAIVSKNNKVHGKVLEATKEEVLLLDEYETAAYKRIRVSLASGQTAWVYCRG